MWEPFRILIGYRTIENNGNDLQFIADEIAIAPIILQKSQVPKIKMRKDDALKMLKKYESTFGKP
ncbi:unnamed protein product [Acanthoscelides obtectus]|uniref:Uncharacterized protein n=1 Tax=Acanthoscelides obtectus TaxID=200917 RepID=A0A9P0KH52_ACAOB|nr:unnamed protein product [Acanthoscelides obtectus]CAK1638648.1 hypothetical protein AOBTE_LOCUS10730 [Acanthoscelides obtectus]